MLEEQRRREILARGTVPKRSDNPGRMVLQKISYDFVKSFRHVHARTSESCGNKSFHRLYMALPRLTPQEVRLNCVYLVPSPCVRHAYTIVII